MWGASRNFGIFAAQAPSVATPDRRVKSGLNCFVRYHSIIRSYRVERCIRPWSPSVLGPITRGSRRS